MMDRNKDSIRIRRLELREFGKFNGDTLELNDSMNIITGRNEAGKTTMALFIRFMLYGIPKRRKKDELTARERIIPFGSDCARGALVVEKNGVLYRIERYFGLSSREDRKFILNDATRERITFTGEPGEFLLGISEETFLRLMYIEEAGPEIEEEGSQEVVERLREFAVTGQDGVSGEGALKLLKDREKSITNSRNTGRLDILRDRNRYIDERLQELASLKCERETLSQEIRVNEEILKDNRCEKERILSSREGLNRLRTLKNYEEALYLIRKKEELQKEVGDTLDMDMSSLGSLKEHLSIYLDGNRRLKENILAYNGKVGEYRSLERNSEKGKQIESEGMAPSREVTAENAARLKKLEERYRLNRKKMYLLSGTAQDEVSILGREYLRIQRRGDLYRNHYPETVLLLLTIMCVVLYGVLRNSDYLLYALIPFILGIAVAVTKYILQMRSEEKAENLLNMMKGSTDLETDEFFEFMDLASSSGFNLDRSRLEEEEKELSGIILGILNDAGCRDLGEYYDREERQREGRRVLLETRADLKSMKSGLDGLAADNRRIYQSIVDRYKETIRRIFPEWKPGDPMDEVLLRRLDGLHIDSLKHEEARKEIERIEGLLKVMSEEVNLNELVLYPESFKEDQIKDEIEKENDFIGRMEDMTVLMAEREEKIRTLRKRVSDLNESICQEIQLLAEKEENLETIDGLGLELSAISLAHETIGSILSRMKEEYLPRVSEGVSHFMKRMTDGKYRDIFLKEDFTLDTETDGHTRSAMYLSRGTRDLLWLGLRMTLYDIIADGEIPLIFDDSFVHLDDGRLMKVMEYLKEREKDRQIIILSCHGRELSILENLKKSDTEEEERR